MSLDFRFAKVTSNITICSKFGFDFREIGCCHLIEDEGGFMSASRAAFLSCIRSTVLEFITEMNTFAPMIVISARRKILMQTQNQR